MEPCALFLEHCFKLKYTAMNLIHQKWQKSSSGTFKSDVQVQKYCLTVYNGINNVNTVPLRDGICTDFSTKVWRMLQYEHGIYVFNVNYHYKTPYICRLPTLECYDTANCPASQRLQWYDAHMSLLAVFTCDCYVLALSRLQTQNNTYIPLTGQLK